MALTGVCAHVSFEQRRSVELFSAHFARQPRLLLASHRQLVAGDESLGVPGGLTRQVEGEARWETEGHRGREARQGPAVLARRAAQTLQAKQATEGRAHSGILSGDVHGQTPDSVKARSQRHRETRNEKRGMRNEKREIGRSGHTATEKRETRNDSVDQ